jgi:hypothetical protein
MKQNMICVGSNFNLDVYLQYISSTALAACSCGEKIVGWGFMSLVDKAA